MARYVPIPNAARYFEVHERTPRNWLNNRFITGYRDTDGEILVDLDEIEAAFPKHPGKMRDGRKRYGNARIVPLPVSAQQADA